MKNISLNTVTRRPKPNHTYKTEKYYWVAAWSGYWSIVMNTVHIIATIKYS